METSPVRVSRLPSILPRRAERSSILFLSIYKAFWKLESSSLNFSSIRGFFDFRSPSESKLCSLSSASLFLFSSFSFSCNLSLFPLCSGGERGLCISLVRFLQSVQALCAFLCCLMFDHVVL